MLRTRKRKEVGTILCFLVALGDHRGVSQYMKCNTLINDASQFLLDEDAT